MPDTRYRPKFDIGQIPLLDCAFMTTLLVAPIRQNDRSSYHDQRPHMKYLYGDGVMKDDLQAVALFRKVAEQGLLDAQSVLAEMLNDGAGVLEDDQ